MVKDQNAQIGVCSDPQRNPRVPTFCKQCCFLLACFLIVFIFIIFGQDYFEQLLWWLDGQKDGIVCLIFVLLYILVAFPFCWGYLLLNLTAGYRFGVLYGFIISMLGVVAGLLVSHFTIGHCCKDTMHHHLISSEYLKATFSFLHKDPKNMKIIALARLTPVPYGLQNAIFSISDVVVWKYMLASAIGLIPIQLLNIYIGSTFRSMQGVLLDSQTSATGYAIFFIQVVLGVVFSFFIARKAKLELTKTLESNEIISIEIT